MHSPLGNASTPASAKAPAESAENGQRRLIDDDRPAKSDKAPAHPASVTPSNVQSQKDSGPAREGGSDSSKPPPIAGVAVFSGSRN